MLLIGALDSMRYLAWCNLIGETIPHRNAGIASTEPCSVLDGTECTAAAAKEVSSAATHIRVSITFLLMAVVRLSFCG